MAGVSGGKEESCKMVEGLHWPSQGLLTDERESVGIVDYDKAESIWLGMDALTEVVHLITNRMNATVLFRAEPKYGFNGERRLFFQDFDDVFKEGCLSRAWRSCDKDVGEVGHHFSYGSEDSILTVEACGH